MCIAPVIERTDRLIASDMHAATLCLHGLTPDTYALASYRVPSGEVGTVRIPAFFGFRCLSCCPGYWSLENLANFVSGHGAPAGSSVWYETSGGDVITAERQPATNPDTIGTDLFGRELRKPITGTQTYLMDTRDEWSARRQGETAQEHRQRLIDAKQPSTMF